MKKMMHILKALGYSYMLTLIILLIYNLILTYTSISSNSITIVTSFITTISAAFGGFYACKHIKENGLVYGFMVGICYIVLLIILFYLAKENYIFDITLYSILIWKEKYSFAKNTNTIKKIIYNSPSNNPYINPFSFICLQA